MAVAGLIGRRVAGFRLVQRLGEGSTGEVFLATFGGAAGRTAALKIIRAQLVAEPGFAERLDRDVRAVAALSHPHILPVYEYGTAGELTYVAMLVAAGGTLRERLSRGRLSVATAWQVLADVGDALQRAHEAGAVHRDVKPANVLFDAYGKVLVADFGVSPVYLGFAVGTPGYMAPEQALGQKADRRADVYGLAVLAFEMLTGTPLYGPASVPELLRATVGAAVPSVSDRCAGLPPGLDAALLRGLAKSRERRYQTVLELLLALGRVLGTEPRREGGRQRGAVSEVGEQPFIPEILHGLSGPSRDGRRREAGREGQPAGRDQGRRELPAGKL
jgi:serine/threonine-protein kinase